MFGHRAADDIAGKVSEMSGDGIDEFEFTQPDDPVHIPAGMRTQIRHIMQHSYFVIPDKQAAVEGFEQVCRIRKQLESEDFLIDRDYVEAKSLATVAYLILKEVI